MDKKYKVWVEAENFGNKKFAYLFVSHGGNSSTGIRIENQKVEIPQIITALQRHLTSAMHSDGEGRAVLEKSSIPGDEETFNNGHGW